MELYTIDAAVNGGFRSITFFISYDTSENPAIDIDIVESGKDINNIDEI